MNAKDYKMGMRVRFTNADDHETMPDFFPPVGTIGEVINTTCCDDEEDDIDCVFIQWPEGSTSDDDCWYAKPNEIEPVEEDSTDGQT